MACKLGVVTKALGRCAGHQHQHQHKWEHAQHGHGMAAHLQLSAPHGCNSMISLQAASTKPAWKPTRVCRLPTQSEPGNPPAYAASQHMKLLRRCSPLVRMTRSGSRHAAGS